MKAKRENQKAAIEGATKDLAYALSEMADASLWTIKASHMLVSAINKYADVVGLVKQIKRGAK